MKATYRKSKDVAMCRDGYISSWLYAIMFICRYNYKLLQLNVIMAMCRYGHMPSWPYAVMVIYYYSHTEEETVEIYIP